MPDGVVGIGGVDMGLEEKLPDRLLLVSIENAAGKLVGASAAAQLADVLEQQCAVGRRFVRSDLSEVPMLDSLGFDVLVAAHHRFLAGGGTLLLTGVGPRIGRLLELTGLGVVMGRATCGVAEATEASNETAGIRSEFGGRAAMTILR